MSLQGDTDPERAVSRRLVPHHAVAHLHEQGCGGYKRHRASREFQGDTLANILAVIRERAGHLSMKKGYLA